MNVKQQLEDFTVFYGKVSKRISTSDSWLEQHSNVLKGAMVDIAVVGQFCAELDKTR